MNRVVKRAVRGVERGGFAVLEFSIQTNHLHLVVEANGKEALSRGMQGFAIRLAKAFNKVWGCRGRVFPERYFARFLHTVNEVRRALRYVLQNARKHGVALAAGVPDPFSSAPWYPWAELRDREPPEEARPTRRGQWGQMYNAMQMPCSIYELPGAREYADTEVFRGS